MESSYPVLANLSPCLAMLLLNDIRKIGNEFKSIGFKEPIAQRVLANIIWLTKQGDISLNANYARSLQIPSNLLLSTISKQSNNEPIDDIAVLNEYPAQTIENLVTYRFITEYCMLSETFSSELIDEAEWNSLGLEECYNSALNTTFSDFYSVFGELRNPLIAVVRIVDIAIANFNRGSIDDQNLIRHFVKQELPSLTIQTPEKVVERYIDWTFSNRSLREEYLLSYIPIEEAAHKARGDYNYTTKGIRAKLLKDKTILLEDLLNSQKSLTTTNDQSIMTLLLQVTPGERVVIY